MKKPTREEAQKLTDEYMKKSVFSDPLLPLPAKKSTKKKKPAAKGKDEITPEEKLLEEICAGNDEPMTEGERAFLLEILRGEIYGVGDRFTGSAITSTLITPEQQKFIDEWNAEHGGK